MKTNIDNVSFKLLYKNFPETHKFYKMLNKNTAKLSYSSMRNMASIKYPTKKTILRPSIQDYGCNCRKENECPMQNKCLTPNITYKAAVINNTDIVKKIILHYAKLSLAKGTVTILDLSGYKVIEKIQNYLNTYGN